MPRTEHGQHGARPFHVLAKPTGAVCNLDCTYCFYLAKEHLYPGSSFRMPDDLLVRYLTSLLEAHRGLPEVVVAFQGGEPTVMGLSFFERVLEIERRLAEPGQRVVNTVQTNATLVDDEWARFLAENDVLVGVSIDGPRALHDAYRVDKGGKPTFDRVMAGLAALRRHGVAWNALTTVHSANADHGLEVYRFLRDELGATFVQLIPIVERDGPDGAVSERTVSAESFGRFLVAVFDEWVDHDVGRVYVQHVDTALARWLGLPDVGLCVHAPTCGRSVALEHTGDLYSCDHFVDADHLLGSLAEGRTLLQVVEDPRQVAFGRAKRDALPRACLACDVLFACNGGCPKDRFATTDDGEPGPNYLCAGYQAFFHHVAEPMREMAALVRAGRDPAEVMAPSAHQDGIPVGVALAGQKGSRS